MALKNNGRLSRREMLRALSVCAAGGAAGLSPFLSGCREQTLTMEDKERIGWRPHTQSVPAGSWFCRLLSKQASGCWRSWLRDY